CARAYYSNFDWYFDVW
nr:immunoglobulin heavy chain junction region [Mus musculus]